MKMENGTLNNAWQILAEYDGTNFGNTYVYGNYIDDVIAQFGIITREPVYFAHDHLYSPAAAINHWGTVIERYEYDAYGTVRFLSPNYEPRTTNLYANAYYFTGRQLDVLDAGSCKLYHYRHRDYSPFMGRFFQPDPLGIQPSGDIRVNSFDPTKQYAEGSCLYQYVNDSPTSNKDPFGLFNPRYTRGWCKRGCKGKCGPDITSQFYAMLSRTHKKLDEEFEKPGRKEKICSGEGLFDLGGIYSEHGWEGVTPTYRLGRGENRWPSGTPCKNTVVFKGHCVNTWELNYYFWGYLNRKCNTSSTKYHFWTDLYTQYKGTYSPEDPHCKRSFAGTGRCGTPVDGSCYYDSCCETQNAPVWNDTIWPMVTDLRP
jgi:RHS repeat-associated protein